MTAGSWLALVPRDTVFVRDGRSFDAAADTSAQPVLPGPATVAGAVGAAFGAEPAEVRGPVLAQRAGDRWQPHFPVPADLVGSADRVDPSVYRLDPQVVPGRTDLDRRAVDAADGGQAVAPEHWLLPPEHAEPVEELAGWMPGRVLADYLAGRLPAAGGTVRDDLDLTEPMVREPRVGLARDDRQARTGYLYQSVHLRPREQWAFLAEVTYPESWNRHAAGPVKFGGRGRLADPEPAVSQWPEHPEGCVKQKVLVYLATPALWPGGWHLPVPPGARLIAAATGRPVPVATLTPGEQWRQTRVLRWAVPAGSVFLLEFESAELGAGWASEVHGTAYAPGTDPRLRTAGFGVVLTGVWT